MLSGEIFCVLCLTTLKPKRTKQIPTANELLPYYPLFISGLIASHYSLYMMWDSCGCTCSRQSWEPRSSTWPAPCDCWWWSRAGRGGGHWSATAARTCRSSLPRANPGCSLRRGIWSTALLCGSLALPPSSCPVPNDAPHLTHPPFYFYL